MVGEGADIVELVETTDSMGHGLPAEPIVHLRYRVHLPNLQRI